MKNVLVFGTGRFFQEYKDDIFESFNVIGFVSNNHTQDNLPFFGKNVFVPKDITEIEFDEILIMSIVFWREIVDELLDMNIPYSKINLEHICKCLRFEKISVNELHQVIAVNNGITAEIRDITSQAVLHETTVFDDYNVEFFQEDCIVIDIGMNVGIVSLYFALRDSVKKVYAFEPFESTYKKAFVNYAMNKKEAVDKIEAHNYGLGASDEKRVIETFYPMFSGSNSTAKPNISETFEWCFKESPYVGTEHNVEVIIKNAQNEIARIINENPDKQVICKIDTEGSEYEIIEALQPETLRQIDVFIIECHPGRLMRTDPNRMLKQALLSNGFCIFAYRNNRLLRAANIKKTVGREF